jgi:hypothetical protein
LNETYTSGVAGGDGRRYYISLYNGTAYALYVYDTWKGIFLQEDTLQVKDFVYLDGYLYALAADHKIWIFNSGTESITSTAITKEFSEDYMGKKGYSELKFKVDLEEDSFLSVYVRINNGSFALVKSYSGTDLSNFTVPLKIKNANHFQIKIVGIGEYKVYQLQRKFYIGEDD